MSDPGFLGYFLERIVIVCGWGFPIILLLAGIGSWLNNKFHILTRIRIRLDK